MILPAEVDDALDALRNARERLGYAIDELNRQHGATDDEIATFRRAHDSVATHAEQVGGIIAAHSHGAWMDAVERRQIASETFPWHELDS